MSSETIEAERIGPQLSLDEIRFSPAVADRFETLYGTEDPPSNGAEWVDAMQDAIEAERGRPPTVEDLCTTPGGEHAFEGPETEQAYICVLDPLAYPFLTGETGTVRSTTPVRGATVEFEVREDGLAVSHEDAVVSVGVSDHLGHIDEVTVETVYRQVCGYIQTFEDEAEYERWAADAEAATTPLPAEEGVALARETARTLFEAE